MSLVLQYSRLLHYDPGNPSGIQVIVKNCDFHFLYGQGIMISNLVLGKESIMVYHVEIEA